MSAAVARADGPVLVMAGGTGGHIFPGLAVADELRARHVPVIWLGADGGLETRLVPQHGVPLQTLPMPGSSSRRGWTASTRSVRHRSNGCQRFRASARRQRRRFSPPRRNMAPI